MFQHTKWIHLEISLSWIQCPSNNRASASFPFLVNIFFFFQFLLWEIANAWEIAQILFFLYKVNGSVLLLCLKRHIKFFFLQTLPGAWLADVKHVTLTLQVGVHSGMSLHKKKKKTVCQTEKTTFISQCLGVVADVVSMCLICVQHKDMRVDCVRFFWRQGLPVWAPGC